MKTEITATFIKSQNRFKIVHNGITYKTDELSKEEIEIMEYYTANDWKNFLKTSYSYFAI